MSINSNIPNKILLANQIQQCISRIIHMTNGIYPSNAGLAHNRKSIKIIPHIKLKKYTIISKDVKKTFYKTHIHL